jgi:hypothetical protein
MTNVNAIYASYDDKMTALYDKEFSLNTSLTTAVASTISDLRMLQHKYSFTTNIDTLITLIETTAKNNEDSIFVKRNNHNVKTILSSDIEHPKFKMLEFKTKLLFTLSVRLYHSTTRLTKYKNMKMPYYSFNYLNTALNVEMSKSILRGYAFNFGLEQVGMGQIKVQEIERKFDRDGYPTDKSINWDESNKFKQALIEEGIEVYNKETTPNGKKWFIYHTEPFIYYINWCISMYSHAAIKLFKFEPTAFINTPNRTSADVLDDYKVDVEDIINNSKLGFITKLNTLLKKDPSYALTYR